MRVRISLKQAYEWPSGNPQRVNKSNSNFINTSVSVPIGRRVTFEELNAYSNAGDLAEEHYKHYQGRTFVSVQPRSQFVDVELIEV